VLASGLRAPHSVGLLDGEPYWIDSLDGAVHGVGKTYLRDERLLWGKTAAPLQGGGWMAATSNRAGTPALLGYDRAGFPRLACPLPGEAYVLLPWREEWRIH
jgi:hypothetical protein